MKIIKKKKDEGEPVPFKPKQVNVYDSTLFKIQTGIDENDEADNFSTLRFCDCVKTICSFYLKELEYFKRKSNGFWHDSYENYYLREFSEMGLSLVRFTLSAGLGELRHACNFKSNLKPKERERVNFILSIAFGGLGWKNIPQRRNYVYRTYIPERLFWKFLILTKEGFDTPDMWGSDFGGEKWSKGIGYAMKLYKYICLADISGVCIYFDTLINHCHNGGIMLNKFNCSMMRLGSNIKAVLDHKHDGNIEYLERVNNASCQESCVRFLLLSAPR